MLTRFWEWVKQLIFCNPQRSLIILPVKKKCFRIYSSLMMSVWTLCSSLGLFLLTDENKWTAPALWTYIKLKVYLKFSLFWSQGYLWGSIGFCFHFKPNQTKPNQTKPNRIKWNQEAMDELPKKFSLSPKFRKIWNYYFCDWLLNDT